jgi:hypothetical protein
VRTRSDSGLLAPRRRKATALVKRPRGVVVVDDPQLDACRAPPPSPIDYALHEAATDPPAAGRPFDPERDQPRGARACLIEVASDHPNEPAVLHGHERDPLLGNLAELGDALPVGERERLLFFEERAELDWRVGERA